MATGRGWQVFCLVCVPHGGDGMPDAMRRLEKVRLEAPGRRGSGKMIHRSVESQLFPESPYFTVSFLAVAWTLPFLDSDMKRESIACS